MLPYILYLFSSCLCFMMTWLTKDIAVTHREKIYDIFHENISIVNMPYISDYMVFIQILYTLILIPKDFFSEFFFIMGIVQILKFICSITTILPPLKTYDEKHRLGGINGNGVEYIFSGHASYSALTAIYLYNFGINFWLIFIYNLISQTLIILTRNHYSVDVILAWIIVPSLYHNIKQ